MTQLRAPKDLLPKLQELHDRRETLRLAIGDANDAFHKAQREYQRQATMLNARAAQIHEDFYKVFVDAGLASSEVEPSTTRVVTEFIKLGDVYLVLEDEDDDDPFVTQETLN